MSIVSCPKCADPVLMPEGASPAATVRCPLCQEEFQLSELLDAMPPVLIVVEDPEAADQFSAPDTLFFADSTTDRPINLLDEVETDSQPRAISIEPLGASAGTSATASSSKRRRTASRPRRKKKSPAMEVVKVVLGGVAGLVIAQAILWWLPWSKYRRDPFELGPKVSEFAGWMVPEEFHGKGKATPAEVGGTGPAAREPNALTQQPLGEPFGSLGTGLPQPTFVDPNQSQDDAQQGEAADSAGGGKAKRPKKQSSAEEEPASASVADIPASDLLLPASPPEGQLKALGMGSAAVEPGDDMEVAGVSVDPLGDLDLDTDLLNMMDPSDDPIIEEPTLEEVGSVLDETGESPTETRIANVPEISGAELRTTLGEANTAVGAWMAAEDANDRTLIGQSYQALAKLAEAVAFARKHDSDEQQQSISDLLLPLLSDPERLSSLKMISQRWPAFAGRDSDGIVLVGKVVGTKKEGDIYETELEVAEGGDPIAIYHDMDPAADCPPGKSIMVLGAIVNDPENNVPGYAGDAATLTWTGQTYALADN